MNKMNTKRLCLIVLCLIGCIFTACDRDKDNDEDSPNREKGYAPASISKREISFTRDGAWHFTSIMYENGITVVTLNAEAFYVAYDQADPVCTWQKKSDNTALYTLEFWHKAYVPYYGTYAYGYNYYSLTLTFTSASGGTYTGTRDNASYTEKRTGIFSIE
jgi:hypothetical protein